MKVLLKYKQREPKPLTIVEKFGVKEYQYQIGFIDYEQEEVIEIDKVKYRIAELKSISNRSYHSFSIEII